VQSVAAARAARPVLSIESFAQWVWGSPAFWVWRAQVAPVEAQLGAEVQRAGLQVYPKRILGLCSFLWEREPEQPEPERPEREPEPEPEPEQPERKARARPTPTCFQILPRDQPGAERLDRTSEPMPGEPCSVPVATPLGGAHWGLDLPLCEPHGTCRVTILILYHGHSIVP
jgi:hypothetical protein